MNKSEIAERATKAPPSPPTGIARMAQYCHGYWLMASLHLLMHHVSEIPLIEGPCAEFSGLVLRFTLFVLTPQRCHREASHIECRVSARQRA